MAPAARDAEIAGLIVPSSDSDTGSSQGSTRKYAVAVAMFALVAVIVGGVGMHQKSLNQDIGEIIEACADYTVESTCSAASCNWDGMKCNVAKLAKSGSMRISTEREAATAPSCGTENATANIGDQFSASTAGQSEEKIKEICQQFLNACPSTEDQAWIQGRPRCAGMTPTPGGACTEVALGAAMAGQSEEKMKEVCQTFLNACPAALSVVQSRPRCAGVTAATAFGGHDSACHQQFSAATSGQSEAVIATTCTTYKAGANGACTAADAAGWITTWCTARR